MPDKITATHNSCLALSSITGIGQEDKKARSLVRKKIYRFFFALHFPGAKRARLTLRFLARSAEKAQQNLYSFCACSSMGRSFSFQGFDILIRRMGVAFPSNWRPRAISIFCAIVKHLCFNPPELGVLTPLERSWNIMNCHKWVKTRYQGMSYWEDLKTTPI